MNDSFDDFLLPDALMRGLRKAGFVQPTRVQQQVIPAALDGTDLLVCAATGSGKTAAFLLPIMERFLNAPSPYTATRALILVPTRELAHQIQDHFHQIGSYSRLTAGVITGGAPFGHQVATLRKNPEILIATPGRLLDHLKRGAAELGDLEVLVLDEADRMLDMGFAPDVLEIIGQINPTRQSMLFSATLRHKGLQPITDLLLKDPKVIVTDKVREQHPDITHQMLLADKPEHKRELLVRLLSDTEFVKALVFTNTREQASALGPILTARGQRTGVLHGELDQIERNRIMGLLRRGDISVLVATDLAARGLDISGMDLVVHFDVGRSGSDYLHRAGRTGRAGERGLSVSLVGPAEWNRMESIVRYLGLDIETRTLEGMEGKFKGPAKRPGKTPLGRKSEPKAQRVKSAARPKDRHRDRKDKGKRRVPSGTGKGVEAGHGPPKKKPQS